MMKTSNATEVQDQNHIRENFSLTVRLIIVVLAALANFIDILDTTIVNVSLRTIAGSLGISPSESLWIVTSYTASLAVTTPISGWLSKKFGTIKLFSYSVFFFTLFSLACAISPNIEMLVISRALQGAAAGPLAPAALGVMTTVVYPKDQGKVVILWSMTLLIAPAVGPWLGGWISDNYPWPYLFYINIPIGIIACTMIAILMSKFNTTSDSKGDLIGFFLLVITVAPLQTLLDKGEQWDWFSYTPAVILAIISFIGLIILIFWELRVKHPILDLRLFKDKELVIITLNLVLGFGIIFSSIVLTPLILQTALGYNSYWAGYVAAHFGLGALVATPFVGFLMSKRVDGRKIVTMCWIVFAITIFWRARFYTGITISALSIPYMVQGLAIAMFFPPLITMLNTKYSGTTLVSATGLTNFTRNLAGSFGVSISETYLNHRAEFHTNRLLDHINEYSFAFTQYFVKLEHQLTREQIGYFIYRTLKTQATLLSINDMFVLFAVLFLLLIPLIWFMKFQDLSGKDRQ